MVETASRTNRGKLLEFDAREESSSENTVSSPTISKCFDDDGRPKRTGTIWTTSSHIITAVVGSGVLSLAWAIAQMGWVAGPAVMLFFSLITWYTSSLLAECYRYGDPIFGKRNYTFMEAVRTILGGYNHTFCGIVQYSNLYCTAVGYTVGAALSMSFYQLVSKQLFPGKLMVTTRRDMKARLEKIGRAREEDRRKMDAVLETVQQLSNSLQALEQAPEILGRLHRRFPYRRDVQEGSYCPRRHSGRHNSGQFRSIESYRRHDRRYFLDSRDDAIKGQMEELIKSMDNILQTVRQLHYVGDYIMSQEHYQGRQGGGYMSDKDRVEEPECQGSCKFYEDRIEENTEGSKDDDEQSFSEAVIRPEMDFVKNQEPRVVVKTE